MSPRCNLTVAVVSLACVCASFAGVPDKASTWTLFRTVPGELSQAQSKDFFDALAKSHVLEEHKLSSQTIDAIGDLIARTTGEEDRRAEYLDGFSGLWSRVGVDVDPLGFANLEDRIARKRGEPQQFGTLVRGKADYPAADAERSYAAARDMIGLNPRTDVVPVQGEVELAMTKPVYPTLPAVRAELLHLGAMDQQVRQEPSGGFKGEEEKAFIKRMSDVDAYTLPRIRAIFNRYGIPTPWQVGRSGTHAAFLLIQHAIQDPALMRGAVAQARQLADKEELPDIDYALLSDRVDCVLDHRPQQFGTQGNRNPESYWFCPIADPSHVNQRRAHLHLAALTEEQIYGSSHSKPRQTKT